MFIFYSLFVGCKSTKFISDDRYLLRDIDIVVDNEKIDKTELSNHLHQKENLKILGLFKFHLWLYNISNKNRESGWLKKIGEPPVVYDEGLKDKSMAQLGQYLYNKGYYQAKVTDNVWLKNKKAKITFSIETGDPYRIRNIDYLISDKNIKTKIVENLDESLLKQGGILDFDILEKERARISNMLKDEGYFNFVDEYIHYKIDTTLYSKSADVQMIVENVYSSLDTLSHPHKKYKVIDYTVFIEKQSRQVENNSKNYTDTTVINNITIYHNGKLSLKESLFLKSFEIKPGELYTKKKETKTYNNLYTLRQFKYVNIQYLEDNFFVDSIVGYLHCNVYLPLQVKQNYSFDIEGTNTSGIEGSNKSGNLGIAGNLNYQHKNIFGGAEIFDITIKGGTERQFARIDNQLYNTTEFGTTAKLTVPGILFPIDEQNLNLFSRPFSVVSVSYNYQDRPDYIRTIVNATLGYRWKSSEKYNHNFNLFDLNAVRIFSIDPVFKEQIKDQFIASSYTDHIISSSIYSFTYNDQEKSISPDYHLFKMNIEIAGNFLWALSSVLNREKFLPKDAADLDQTPFYKFLGSRYAQYIKGDFDFRYGYRFDKYNSIAMRGFAGIAFPYGNFNVIPFEKRYFTGGANGVRAWQVRSLGPGSYIATFNEYPNQSSDIKLEANVEYRFKLFWMLHGAFFIDAGNIWAINGFDNREGAIFKIDRFYKEFAIGTGFGLRLVSPYFVLRADLGMKLRDPSLTEGIRWIPQSRSFNMQDFNFNIGIGYPF